MWILHECLKYVLKHSFSHDFGQESEKFHWVGFVDVDIKLSTCTVVA